MSERYIGRVDLAAGRYYEGELLDGRLDGKGTLYFPGGVFVGEFRDGKRNGPGLCAVR